MELVLSGDDQRGSENSVSISTTTSPPLAEMPLEDLMKRISETWMDRKTPETLMTRSHPHVSLQHRQPPSLGLISVQTTASPALLPGDKFISSTLARKDAAHSNIYTSSPSALSLLPPSTSVLQLSSCRPPPHKHFAAHCFPPLTAQYFTSTFLQRKHPNQLCLQNALQLHRAHL